MAINVCCAGSVEDGERALRPRRSLGPALFDAIRPKPHTEHRRAFDATVPWGLRYQWQTRYLPALDEARKTSG